MIIAEINKLFASRLGALAQQTNSSDWLHMGDPKAMNRGAQLRAIQKEKREILWELLGLNCYEEAKNLSGVVDHRDRMFAFLPVEKREAVRDLVEKYEQLEQHSYWKAHGFPLPGDESERKKLKVELRQGIAELLIPAELEQYDLKNSPLANDIRFKLQIFQPTEEEFVAIYRLADQFEKQNDPPIPGSTFSDRNELWSNPQARERFEKQLKAQLGEHRFAEYKLSQDPQYVEIGRFTQRFEFPRETAVQMYELRKAVESQTIELLADTTLSDQQKAPALNGIRAETEKALDNLIGKEALNAYKRNGSSAWISPSLKR